MILYPMSQYNGDEYTYWLEDTFFL